MKALVLAAAATVVFAQSAAPGFEVASIKQNKSGATGGLFGGPPSRFTATNTPAQAFITYAFRVQDFQIEGAPDWVKHDRWDVNAKADGNSPATTLDGYDPRREMVRALLMDRFKLAAHTETRDRPIYALVLARPGQVSARLHPSTTDCAALENTTRSNQSPRTPPLTPDGFPDCTIRDPPGRIAWGTQTMRQVAAVLSDTVQWPVVDRTGLEGNFSALVTFRPDNVTGPDQPVSDPNAASIFTALQEQLGLRLESTRGPVDILVIDHIERPAED